jgi:7-cyano-7-deazaguanine synthase in queuosine biosynthesis
VNGFKAKVGSAESAEAAGTLLLVAKENLVTGLENFRVEHSDFTTLEEDMLTVASAIFACDLAFKRGEREEITRSITLEVPVVNYHAFQNTKDDLELLLWTLSHDNWSIKFTRVDGQPEPRQTWPKDRGATILFSGGVDSFAGALELLLARGRDGVQLASHVTGNPVTRQSQDDLISYLETRFKGPVNRVALRSGGRNKGKYVFPSDSDREETQRTRSFMYLSVAALAARRSGHNELVLIAENGQMAIHLPLSVARVGAFSTHTAHPEFVAQAASFFSRILDCELKVNNPYLYKTKSEVVATVSASDQGALSQSVSCWRGARVPSFNHCGDCVPCLVRRIAFESNNIVLAEYKHDLLAQDVPNLPEGNEGKRNLVELTEFVHAFASRTDAELEGLFPDLISTDFDRTAAIKMYRRFAVEARTVLSKYPGPAKLLAPLQKQGAGPQPVKAPQV